MLHRPYRFVIIEEGGFRLEISRQSSGLAGNIDDLQVAEGISQIIELGRIEFLVVTKRHHLRLCR